MFCGYCGKENAKDYSFCAGCGKPLESATPNHPTKVPSKDYDFSDPPMKSPPPPPSISDKIRKAVEEQRYYVDQFVSFYETGQGIKYWNWAAFFLGPFWCLYKKVYPLFFVWLIANTVIYWVEKADFSAFTQLVIGVLWVCVWIQNTIEANKAHYKNVLKKLDKEANKTDYNNLTITLLKL